MTNYPPDMAILQRYIPGARVMRTSAGVYLVAPSHVPAHSSFNVAGSWPFSTGARRKAGLHLTNRKISGDCIMSGVWFRIETKEFGQYTKNIVTHGLRTRYNSYIDEARRQIMIQYLHRRGKNQESRGDGRSSKQGFVGEYIPP
jgi:hypothetical protein